MKEYSHLQIDVYLNKPVDSQSIWMRHIRTIPFVPRNGDTIRLTDEAEENTKDLTLDGVVYDASSGVFIAEISDGSMVDRYSETGGCGEKEIVAEYVSFGFLRMNYPTAQAIKDTGL